MEKEFCIGIDLGGTNIKGVLINENGNISERMELPTKDSDEGEGEPWKQTVREMVEDLRNRSSGDISAVGLSAPGIADEANRSIACMPGRLQGLEYFYWDDFLALEKVPVKVLNDAQAALIAESSFGAAKGFRHVVMLTLGTGVGGGILINGELYQGHFQRAGHLGHICLNEKGHRGITGMPGTLEEAIGNASLERRSNGKYSSTDKLLNDVLNGDSFASWLWLDSVRNLALGIGSLINAFAPEVVILGGGITRAGEDLFKPLERFLNDVEWRPAGVKTPVRKARFQNDAGAIGAAGFALSFLKRKPE
ncbi:MAG: ROK family protein [Balneolaceae bacterium]|nr:ROK family protein [Balneolaceae bacterium]